jgi:hypothetical protein
VREVTKEKSGKCRGIIREKAMLSIVLPTLLVVSILAAVFGTTGAYSNGGLYNIIDRNEAGIQKVLRGQDLEFQNFNTTPTVYRVVGGGVVNTYIADGSNRIFNVNWPETGAYYVNYGAADEVPLSVEDANVPLALKVGTTSVTSIAKGTNLIIDVSGINLFDEDGVKLVVRKGDSVIKTKSGQTFDPIMVGALKSLVIDTTDWEVGDYTFQVKTDANKACGLDASSVVKELNIITGEIAIEAEKTFCVELQAVRLTVTGVPGDDIHVASSPLSPNVIFRPGVDDTPVDATNQFNHIIDADGVRTYSVKFSDTGTFTIKVTVTSGPRAGDYATVDITVSETAVVFDVPSTVVIGEKLDIKGTANIGSYVDIFIDDVLYAQLNDLVLEADGTFSKEVTTTDVGMTVPGSVMLKAWIDATYNVPGDDPPLTSADGSAAILVLHSYLNVVLSKTTVSPGDSFEVYGNAASDYIELVILSPNGGNGTGIDGLYGTTIYTVPTFCNYTNYNFYKKIKVDSDADNGNYTVIVLTPGRDNAYGTSEYSYVDSILDLDGADPELGAINTLNKTQEEIIGIIEDVIYAAGSDDFLWIGDIVVTKFESFDTGEGSYPSIMGTHNGTITPSCTINVSKLYTYPCAGTGGHTAAIELFETGELIANGSWNGYHDDWHNITITPSVTLLAGLTYNYTIVTGSYPQIHHTSTLETPNGWITCVSFKDVNGIIHDDWIPAIRLWTE